jgi:phosphoglycerate dehydrogenase-like enzyme
MTTFLLSGGFLRTFGDAFHDACRDAGIEPRVITLPDDPKAFLPPDDVAAVEVTYFSDDIHPRYTRPFFGITTNAPNLKWMHLMNAGVDSPVFSALLQRGVRLTTSSGSTAKPIAQTAIGGMLMLARGFPAWGRSQRAHEWLPDGARNVPPDLAGQTMVVVGVGAIGNEIARLARAIGLHVIGVRRSPMRNWDEVDEMQPPAMLPALLPRADWLALACPLTDETRGLISADALALLPPGAGILNIARGEVIDESALIAALASGRLLGAYLDVFAEEPLPAASPLWDMPNVVISPHNSAASAGNRTRQADYFLRNIRNFAKGAPFENEVRTAK